MEIRTCEAYVLSRLARLEEEYDEVVDRLAEKTEEVKSLTDTLAWSSEERMRLETELEAEKARTRTLEATCSDFARKLDRARRGLPEVDDGQ